MIVVFGSVKGDQGKTTAAFNLAVQRTMRGKRVLLVDADDQFSATKWANRREDAGVTPSLITEVQVGRMIGPNIQHKAADYDDVIIDTRGADSGELRGSALVADVFVSPVQPLQLALETLGKMATVIEPIKRERPDLRVLLLTSRVIPRAGSMTSRDDVKTCIDDIPVFEVAETVIHSRSAHETAARMGLGVIELKGRGSEKAREEMLQLEKEIWGNE